MNARCDHASAWAVSSGCYSDYRVHAVFTFEDEARAYADHFNEEYKLTGDGTYGVEELPLDPKRPEAGTRCYSVYITRKGDIVACEPSEYAARHPDSNEIKHGWAGPGWSVACFARDAEHARKIATEYRQAELAKEAVVPAVAHPCVGVSVGVPPNTGGVEKP